MDNAFDESGDGFAEGDVEQVVRSLVLFRLIHEGR